MSKLVREHTAVVLIDHQRMLMSLLPEERRVQLRHHMKILLKIARAFDLPIIATSNLEDGVNGPIAEVIQDHAPEAFEARIKRQGEFNAFENHEFGAAVAATGRRTLLIAGFSTDVAVTLAGITACERGFNVHSILDASDSPSARAAEACVPRMEQAGITSNTTIAAMAELAISLASPQGLAMMKVVAEDMVFATEGPLS